MAFRAVGTNDGQYMGIGGQNQHTMMDEDPAKEYVNIYVVQRNMGTSITVSADVKYLMQMLQAEGFIRDFILPESLPEPLTQVERVAKGLMQASESWEYSDEEFRRESDYQDYIQTAEDLLKGDN